MHWKSPSEHTWVSPSEQMLIHINISIDFYARLLLTSNAHLSFLSSGPLKYFQSFLNS